ncbi:monovalent cation:proton antiporter-2 (CPA2) family protein, partial [Bacteroidota bacterium]
MSGGFLYQAFVYLAAAVVAVPIAKKFGLGAVLGYLLAGIAIGPFGLSLVGNEGADVMHFAEFGVVMMLFLIGLELEPTLLWRLRTSVLGLGGLQVGLTTLVIVAIGMGLGYSWQVGLAVGMTLSMSSTAIVLSTLDEKSLMRTQGGEGAFSVLLFQDMAVIPMLAIIPLLVTAESGTGAAGHVGNGHGQTWITSQPGWLQTVVVLGAVAAIIIAGKYLLRPVFRSIARTRQREIFTAAALLLIIGIALLMQLVGLSPALGTFVAGVVLANSEYRHELESNLDPFKGLLLGLFFIAVGAFIDFELIMADPGRIVLMVFVLIAIKFAVLFGLSKVFGFSLDQGLLLAFALPQTGEFAFVLFSFASQEGVLGATITGPLVAVVALSMALTPLLLLLFERVVAPRVGVTEAAPREPDAIDEQNPVIVAGFGGFGSTVGRFLRANGIQTTVLDVDPDRVELLRKFGLKVYYGDGSRQDLLHAAGADKAKILILAIDRPEKTIELVHTARTHFPHLTILARAFDWDDAHDLLEAGVDHVYRHNLDTSLRLGEDALQMLGFRAHKAHRLAQKFRTHDQATLMQLRAVKRDDKQFVSV